MLRSKNHYRRGPALAASGRSFVTGSILVVRDLLHPVDDLAVQRFLNGDVGHRGGGRGAVPVLLTRREPDHIAAANFLDQAALALHAADPGGDDKGLTQWMGVPGRAGSGLERDTCAAGAG